MVRLVRGSLPALLIAVVSVGCSGGGGGGSSYGASTAATTAASTSTSSGTSGPMTPAPLPPGVVANGPLITVTSPARA
jgi:hypothetical protein